MYLCSTERVTKQSATETNTKDKLHFLELTLSCTYIYRFSANINLQQLCFPIMNCIKRLKCRSYLHLFFVKIIQSECIMGRLQQYVQMFHFQTTYRFQQNLVQHDITLKSCQPNLIWVHINPMYHLLYQSSIKCYKFVIKSTPYKKRLVKAIK
jgi:hypothetical protein